MFKKTIPNKNIRKYISNTTWLIGEKILRMVVALFVGLYVARYLGVKNFGLLNYVASFVGLFSILATLGLDSIVTRELVKSEGLSNKLLGTAFWLKIGGVILSWLSIILTISLTDTDTDTIIFITIIAFAMVFQTSKVIDFNYQAQVRSKFIVYAQLLQLVISSIFKLILIYLEAPLIWFVWGYCLDAIVLAIGLIVLYLNNTGRIFDWRWDWSIAKSLLKDSWALIFYSSFVVINLNIDTVMLKNMIGNESVGYYSAAKTLSTAWYFIPVLVGSTFFPYIINRKNDISYKNRIKSLFGFLSIIALFGASVISYSSYWIIYFLYGIEYIESAKILSIHIWTGVFVFHVSIRTRLLVSDNLQYITLWVMLPAMILNIIGNYFFIPLYGGLGAAYASLFSWAANVLLIPLFSRKCNYYTLIFFVSPIHFLLNFKGKSKC